MTVNAQKVGVQIQNLRKAKKLTQAELGAQLGVTYQAVSKWERGETIPDVTLLPDLALILDTTIDSILLGGERIATLQKQVNIEQLKEGIACFDRLGELLGKDSLFYTAAIEGINQRMNMDIETYLQDSYTREALLAETVLQHIQKGAYVNPMDISKSFCYPHWKKIVSEYAERYGIK